MITLDRLPPSDSIVPAGAATIVQLPSGAILQSQGMAATQPASGGINIVEIWVAIRRRRKLALLVGASVAALAFATTLWQRAFSPVYQGSFELLITDPISTNTGGSGGGGGDGGSGGGVIENLARNRTSIDYPTLIGTLRSPMVLDPLRSKLGAAGGLVYGVNITQAAGPRAGAPQGVLVVSLMGQRPSEIRTALAALSSAYLNFALQQRQQQLNEGLNFLNEQEPLMQSTVNLLQGKLADFRGRHNLIAPEAEAAALKGEAAGMEMQQRQLEAERSRLEKLRLGVASGKLTSSSFSTGSGSAGGGTAEGGGDGGVTVTQSNSDLLSQLQSVEQQLSEARSTYRSDTPRVQSLSALSTRLAGQLRSNQLEALDTALQLNANRLATLRGQRNLVDRQFLKQPTLIKEYEQIQQKLKLAQENLSNFLTTRTNFRLERAQNSAPWALISPPRVQGFPVEPRLRDGLLRALLFGAAAGAGAALLRDRLDHGFRSPGEARDELREPLLGHIPHVSFFKGVRENSRFLLQELDTGPTISETSSGPGQAGGVTGYQRFFYQEAFRNLFTSLRFLNTDRNLRTIALTSSLPAEGKSLVNVLLAKTLSEMGQRVLLIDADLRKPQIHFRLGLNNLVGLSNLLTEDLTWQEVAIPVEGHDNWMVIPAGRRPPDPTRLLSSERMRHLVEQLGDSGQFDLILFDTPPVLGLADAALVAEQADGVILLVSLDRVDRDLPREAISRMRSSGAPLLGIVTNSIKAENRFSGASGNGRYGYGSYGYGRYGKRYGYGSYGSYDYRIPYGHYTDAQLPAAESPTKPKRQPLAGLRAKGRSLMHWIDN